VIFGLTVAENIAYGREEAPSEKIVAAAKRAQAHDFIMALPPVLLLDEATSALDAENEALVQAALHDVMQGRTSLVIAHRLATVLEADRIVVIDDGRMVEQGTHASLIAAGGLYARLAKLQFDTDRAGAAA
jgi:ATP-binding cassette subfamily B protein